MEEAAPLCAFELQRLATMARNKVVLDQLMAKVRRAARAPRGRDGACLNVRLRR
jgi:hypothetical protein